MQVPPPVPSFPHSEQQPVISALKRRDFRPSHVGWLGFGLSLAGLLAVLLARPAPRARFLPAVLVTLCFAAGAWMLRGVTLSGALAGFLATLLLFVAAGPPLFGAVLLVFVLTYGATRLGRDRKQSLHIAERPSGRDAAQILANIGFAALFAALAQITSLHVSLLVGSVAALAEAACDTVSSETGKVLAKNPRLITSLRPVAPGTDGALSTLGTLLGIAAAALIGLEASWTRMLTARFAAIASIAGILGMLFDSLLGATLERFGRLTNNGVNLVSTAFASLLAAFAAWQFS
jgi:uncharacterized protein (TIGR00297 family)